MKISQGNEMFTPCNILLHQNLKTLSHLFSLLPKYSNNALSLQSCFHHKSEVLVSILMLILGNMFGTDVMYQLGCHQSPHLHFSKHDATLWCLCSLFWE